MNEERHNSPESLRVFETSYSKLVGRWDPLFYETDMYQFISGSGTLVPLGTQLKMTRTGFAAGKSEQGDEENGIIQIRPTNLSEDHSLVFQRNIYISRQHIEGKSQDLLKRGEVLFNNTNSQELVGKTVLFDLDGDFVASNHITRLRVNDELLNNEFLACLLNLYQARGVFYRLCTNWNNQSGVSPQTLESVLVPSLDLNRQEAIADRWRNALRLKKDQESQANHLLATIDDVLLDELGISRNLELPNTLERRIFISQFSDLTDRRWDPIFHQADVFEFIRDTNCDLRRLGSLVDYFITGFPAGRGDQVDEADGGVIQIRPTNLNDDRELIFRRNVYIDTEELRTRKTDVLKRREVLFNNTNSQEQVGKTVWFDLGGDYFSSNHVTRIGTKSAELNPQYLAAVLNLYQRKKVFFKLCTNWNNQSGVGSDILARMPVPIPTQARQAAIVEKLETVRDKARTLRGQARADLEKAKREIEALILGK